VNGVLPPSRRNDLARRWTATEKRFASPFAIRSAGFVPFPFAPLPRSDERAKRAVHTQIAPNAGSFHGGSALPPGNVFSDDVTDPASVKREPAALLTMALSLSAGSERRLMHHRSLCFQVTAVSTSSAASS